MVGREDVDDLPTKTQVIPRAYSAGRWAVAGEVVSRLAQPFVLLVLARALTPEDLGVVTAATIVVSFAQIFWEAGLAKALVQTSGERSELDGAASTALWTNLILALVIYAVLYVGSSFIAVAFGDPRLTALLQVQGLAIPLLAVGVVPVALFQRELRFRPIFAARLAAAFSPALIGLPLALTGAGYWALVIGSLAGTGIQVAMLFGLSGPRFRRCWSLERLRSLAKFSAWSVGEATVSWSMHWLDMIVVGIFLTSHELGLFRASTMLATIPFALAIGSLMPVLFAALSRIRTDSQVMVSTFSRAVKGAALLAMLTTALVVAAPSEWSKIALGEPWRELGTVVRYLAVVYGIGFLAAPNAELYRAMGRPDLNLKIVAGCLMVYVPLLIWGAQRGLQEFLVARIIAAGFGVTVYLLVTWRIVGMSPAKFTKGVGCFIVGGVLAGLAGYSLQTRIQGGDLFRAICATGAAGIVFAVVCIFERRYIVGLIAEVRNSNPHDSTG